MGGIILGILGILLLSACSQEIQQITKTEQFVGNIKSTNIVKCINSDIIINEADTKCRGLGFNGLEDINGKKFVSSCKTLNDLIGTDIGEDIEIIFTCIK